MRDFTIGYSTDHRPTHYDRPRSVRTNQTLRNYVLTSKFCRLSMAVSFPVASPSSSYRPFTTVHIQTCRPMYTSTDPIQKSWLWVLRRCFRYYFIYWPRTADSICRLAYFCRVGQKVSLIIVAINNCVYCQPTFIIFDTYIHYRKFATGGYTQLSYLRRFLITLP